MNRENRIDASLAMEEIIVGNGAVWSVSWKGLNLGLLKIYAEKRWLVLNQVIFSKDVLNFWNWEMICQTLEGQRMLHILSGTMQTKL